MQRMARLLLVFTSVAFGTSAATADTIHNWAGAYVGAYAGHEWMRSTHDLSMVGGAQFPTGSHPGQGFVGGANAGYNWQAGRFVVGIEADVGTGSRMDFVHRNGFQAAGSTSISWQTSVRARFGLAFGPVLVYGTAGVGWAKVSGTDGPIAGPFARWDETRQGSVFGGGLQYALTDRWSARAEALFGNYGGRCHKLAPLYPAVISCGGMRSTEARIGVNYRF